MNKLLLVCGLVLLGNMSTQDNKNNAAVLIDNFEALTDYFFAEDTSITEDTAFISDFSSPEIELDAKDIVFLEQEEEVSLGFNADDYLPEGFSPFEFYFKADVFELIEENTFINLGFDSKKYLPEGFDPYAAPITAEGMSLIEEDEVDLEFDSSKHLPIDFNPYKTSAM